jgi:hypothetical protein
VILNRQCIAINLLISSKEKINMSTGDLGLGLGLALVVSVGVSVAGSLLQ